MIGAAGLAMAMIAWPCAANALAQTKSTPQPTPRPHELQQAPVEQMQQQPPPTTATEAPEAPASPLSPQELRSRRRICGEEWGQMKKSGRTRGLTWADFFENCSKNI
jgi:hypothetical protein